ncbi:tripartite tricarboxylate transporter substrate binding protein [Achromobacter aegrifaciens]|uniref:Bug family tripartite tricarboxylate transporter substrate binding protein n=1 Tax=Achromobacter aegrifaciens TaxID=1287736 RepID=UPI0027B8EC72|nr:tripartite tricarboxylate transporter substrate binding protein [Achromobacter aegrifaciens]WLW63706.1 tripartite tricarboxylate transporter substrate binding protein [Achromobacter aegrifaciens]
MNSRSRAARRTLLAAILLGTGLVGSGAVHAAWPEDQAIKVIVPQAAGGTNDTVARLIGVELGKALGQSVVVENQPGASGAIGMQAAARSPANGYTLAIASDTAAVLSATRKMGWRLDRDMMGVALVGEQPMAVAVSARSEYRSLAQLISAAKDKPDTVAFGTSGLGTSQHIIGEWLAHLAGVQMVHVPYKGGGQAVTDLVAGNTPAAVLGFAPLLAQARNHAVRIVAITTAERNPATPEVPTLKELGYSDITRSQWVGVVTPRGTPPAIVKRLSDAIGDIVRQPAIQAKLMEIGVTPNPMDGATFDGFIHKEVADYGSLVTQLHIKLD